MKIIVKYIVLLLIVGMVLNVVAGCKKKTEGDQQQPPIVENTIEDEKDEVEKDDKKDKQEDIANEDNTVDKENKEIDGKVDKKTVIKLENELGQEVIIKEQRDKLLAMTFWVDWNQQSKEQLEILENIYPLVKDDVKIVGVHATGFDTLTKEEVKKKIKEVNYSYPMLIDEVLEAQQKYYVGGFPTTIIIDYEGNIIRSFTSVIEEDQLLDEIEVILEKFLP